MSIQFNTPTTTTTAPTFSFGGTPANAAQKAPITFGATGGGDAGAAKPFSFGITTTAAPIATSAAAPQATPQATPAFGSTLFGGASTAGTGIANPLSGAATSTPAPLNFGLSTVTSTPAFGAPATSAAPNFGVPQTNTPSFGIPAPTTAFGIPQSIAPTPASMAPTGALPNLGLPKTAAPNLATGGISLGTAPAPTLNLGTGLGSTLQPTFGLGIGSLGTTTQPQLGTGLALGVATTTAPKLGLGLGLGGATTTVPAAAQASATAINLGGGGIGLGITTAPPTLGITAPATTSNSGAFTNLTTATKTTNSTDVIPKAAQISYNKIEDDINKWTMELEKQEKIFSDQATQINAWDRILHTNNNKIIELNQAVRKAKSDQQALEQEMEFIATQHKELEESILPLQKDFNQVPQVDLERSHTYLLVENLDTQLKQMSEDLKEIIDNLNETNKNTDNSDPIVQIGKILNAHMSSLQWIEASTETLGNKLSEIDTMQANLQRDNELSRSAYFNN